VCLGGVGQTNRGGNFRLDDLGKAAHCTAPMWLGTCRALGFSWLAGSLQQGVGGGWANLPGLEVGPAVILGWQAALVNLPCGANHLLGLPPPLPPPPLPPEPASFTVITPDMPLQADICWPLRARTR
jgi:hypothetical protein